MKLIFGGSASPKTMPNQSRRRRLNIPLRSENAIHLFLAALTLFAIRANAAEVIPPTPGAYFNDYAGVVSPGAAQRFNEQLAQFERQTSNQIVVAIWRKMPSQSSIEDFTQRTFQAWQIVQKGRNNGVVFFVFIDDHRMRIQPGYGSASALSMIDGRTMLTGTAPLVSVRACSPSALVNAYASGQPTLAARDRPASTS